MGQRLVIEVIEDKERVANIYYHWSAYSVSALYEARGLVDYLADHNDGDTVLNCIRYAVQNGGCIDAGDKAYAQSLYPNETLSAPIASRSNGIVSISQREMDVSSSWAEGTLIVDMDKRAIRNEVYYFYDSIDEYNDNNCYEDDERVNIENVHEVTDIDVQNIKFEDINDVIQKLDELKDDVFINNGTIYQLIM